MRIDLLAAILIFLVTIVLVIWQPYQVGLGWNVRLGAVLALLSGLVQSWRCCQAWSISAIFLWSGRFSGMQRNYCSLGGHISVRRIEKDGVTQERSKPQYDYTSTE
ncbi:ArsB/NhaD family transporter [Nitrosospira multiformis]|uniref:ArsB/NhaD family transporter n=1 Tax=Nitrosospira multiformis TaxID=1231 RepID=UPI00404704E6